ncbi:hypothetical protein GE061_019106 [Apolygus lucorum]|uniref:Uncharacterized protein n=1 Tax=Apolygus lucorum TaxID=248454 RepID=A0A6A4JX53_APOLU|nr:hypothetical protein GE061_019106 [Apolygus lucorum]
MHFVIFFLIPALYGGIEAGTSTKINYLPNGQVGGYELIINNTVPALISRTAGRPSTFKQANKIVKTDGTYTRIHERVEGDNSFVNVQSLIRKSVEKPKFPLSAILTVPSVQYNGNGVAENSKLTFAKIGPYAALIVPVENPGEFWDGGKENSVSSEIRNSVKAFVEVSDPPVSKQKDGLSYPPKFSAAGVPSVESRASDQRIVGGFSRRNKVGPYEPAAYEYSNRKEGNKMEYHESAEKIQESGKLVENTGVRTVQTSDGLFITLPNKSLTLYAPTPKQKIFKGISEEESNVSYPYPPAVRPSKIQDAAVETVQRATPALKSRYYSFSLSEQPPNVSWSVKENEGLQVQDSLPNNESGRSETSPLPYSFGKSIFDSKGGGVTITKEEPTIGNPYPPPFKEAAADTSLPIITEQTYKANGQIFGNLPKHIQSGRIFQKTTSNSDSSSSDIDTPGESYRPNPFPTNTKLEAELQSHHQPSYSLNRYASKYSSPEEFALRERTNQKHPSPVGPVTGSLLETLDGIVTV